MEIGAVEVVEAAAAGIGAAGIMAASKAEISADVAGVDFGICAAARLAVIVLVLADLSEISLNISFLSCCS